MPTFVRASAIIAAVSVAVAAIAACNNGQQPPPQPNGYPPQPNGPQPNGPQPNGYPPPTAATAPPTGYPTANPQPSATAPTPSTTATAMGTGGFFPCTQDIGCAFGKCNPQTQKCVFPCQSTELDCQAGHTCNPNGFCL